MSVNHVLVATDGSENATVAVRWAGELAAQTGSRVTAVHVFEPLAHLSGTGPLDLAELREVVRRELHDRWCAPLVTLGIEHDAEVLEGKPAAAIADAASKLGADLIVIGARGLSSVRCVVLGSTSQRLPHITSVPVVIVSLADER